MRRRPFSIRRVQEPCGSFPCPAKFAEHGGKFSFFSREVVQKLRFLNNFIFFCCFVFFVSVFLSADEGSRREAQDDSPAPGAEITSPAGDSAPETLTGQQPGEEFFTELEEVLSVNIAARVSESGEDAVWKVESSKCTVSGRSVSVKLVGDNIVILVDFIPYTGADDSIVLVARGQVWISSQTDEPMKYLSTLESIPVKMGEKVLFFPLGVKSLEAVSEHTYDIEMEIQCVPRGREQG
jgi:hypothetical protein